MLEYCPTATDVQIMSICISEEILYSGSIYIVNLFTCTVFKTT